MVVQGVGCLYSRAAEKGNSRKLGFRCMEFSETGLPIRGVLGNWLTCG